MHDRFLHLNPIKMRSTCVCVDMRALIVKQMLSFLHAVTSHFSRKYCGGLWSTCSTIDLIANRPYLPMSFVHSASPDRCLSPNVLNASATECAAVAKN